MLAKVIKHSMSSSSGSHSSNQGIIVRIPVIAVVLVLDKRNAINNGSSSSNTMNNTTINRSNGTAICLEWASS